MRRPLVALGAVAVALVGSIGIGVLPAGADSPGPPYQATAYHAGFGDPSGLGTASATSQADGDSGQGSASLNVTDTSPVVGDQVNTPVQLLPRGIGSSSAAANANFGRQYLLPAGTYQLQAMFSSVTATAAARGADPSDTTGRVSGGSARLSLNACASSVCERTDQPVVSQPGGISDVSGQTITLSLTISLTDTGYVDVLSWMQTNAIAYGGLSTLPNGGSASVSISATLTTLSLTSV